MTDEPAGLTDVVAAIAAHLTGSGHDSLSLPSADRYVLLLIDGLGLVNLAEEPGLAPALHALPGTQMRVGLPSTTTASITSLLTGAEVAQHGLVGFSFRTRPGFVMSSMVWDDPRLRPENAQPVPTWFERLSLPSAVVVPAAFAGSGLTRAIMRGADFVGVDKESDWAAQADLVAQTARTHPFTYAYVRSLDSVGHAYGWRSKAWRRQLARVDGFVGSLLERLPGGTALVVTSDHGMVDAPVTHKVLIDGEPELSAGVDLVGGEARFRYLYTDEPDAVARRWANWWGDRADVRARTEALPWFGTAPPAAAIADRIGDVVVAFHGDWVALTSARPREANMVGMHGSLTDRERLVPLLKGMV